jgi:GDP-L-fucose synthase
MKFDFIYIEDVCKIIEWFINNEFKEKTYNICSGEPTNLVDVACIISRIMKVDSVIEVDDLSLNNHYTGNNLLLIKELNNFKFTPLKKGIKKYYEWYLREVFNDKRELDNYTTIP